MTENLKSCPFCGSNAEFNSDEFGEGVDCKSCGATLRNGVYGEYGRKLASAAWNTRPLEDAIQKELDEAREDNCENMEYHVAERKRLKKEIVNLEAENKMLIGVLKAIKKIVDKPPMSIYDAARIYAECCDALGGGEE